MKTAVLDSRFFIFKRMNKQQILEKLQSIKYPGFNRDIVSFGMVKEISIEGKNVELKLNITSQNEEKKLQVVKDIKILLSKYFSDVKITVASQNLQNNFANVFCTEKFEDSWNYNADLLKLDMEPRLNTNRSDKDYKKNINRKNLSEQFIAWHKNYNSYDYALYEEFCT